MDTKNRFYNDLVKIRSATSLPDKLGWMAIHSQSVILNYGEDNCQWECSWIISSGKRFTSVRSEPLDAINDVLSMVRDEALFNFSEFETGLSEKDRLDKIYKGLKGG